AMLVTAAPPAYDLRNVNGHNFITPIEDQGQCGSCVAFGSIATVEGTARVQHNDPNMQIDLSEAQLFFCDASTQGATCATGWYVDAAMTFLANTGVADAPCFPYSDHD